MITASSELRALRRLVSESIPSFKSRINMLVDTLGGPEGWGRKQWLVEAGGIGWHTAARWLDGEDWDPKSNVVEDFAARITQRWDSVSRTELAQWLKNGTPAETKPASADAFDNPLLIFRICRAIDRMTTANKLTDNSPGFEDLVSTAMEHLMSFSRETRSEITDDLLYSIADSIRILIQKNML
jgi:hypothetical protein